MLYNLLTLVWLLLGVVSGKKYFLEFIWHALNQDDHRLNGGRHRSSPPIQVLQVRQTPIQAYFLFCWKEKSSHRSTSHGNRLCRPEHSHGSPSICWGEAVWERGQGGWEGRARALDGQEMHMSKQMRTEAKIYPDLTMHMMPSAPPMESDWLNDWMKNTE